MTDHEPSHVPPAPSEDARGHARDAGIETVEWLMLGVVLVVAIVAASVLLDDLITDVFARFRDEIGL